MPSPQVDAAVQQATAMLDDQSPNSAKVARDALDYLKSAPGLTTAEREEAVVATATHAASKGCDEAISSPNTLLRSNTAYTAFIKETLSDYSQEFQEAVRAEGQEVLGAMMQNLPERGIATAASPDPTLTTHNMPRPGFRPDANNAMDQADVDAWDQFYEQGAKALVQVQTDNLSKMHPVALNTLKACEDVARDKFSHLPANELDTVVSSMNVNNAILRVSSPVLATQVKPDPSLDPAQQALQKNVITRTCQVSQTYFNGAEGTQAANVTKLMRADAGFTDATNQQMKEACNGQLVSTAAPLPEPAIATPVVDQPAVATPAVDQPAAKVSVRDMLKSAASSLKNTIKEKLGLDDQSKLERMEKQLAKRENHVADLEKRKAAVDLTLKDPDIADALNKKYDVDKHLTGTGPERAEQMEIKEAQDLKKASDKLGGRIDKNEDKAQELKDKIGALQTKMEMKAARQQAKQEVGAAGGVKV